MATYTRIPNWLIDEAMRTLSPGAFKVAVAVARSTIGWGKSSDVLSYSQLSAMTGIANRTNLNRAINECLTSGWIKRQAAGQSFSYSLTSTETVPVNIGTSTETVPVEAPTSTETVPELVPKQYTQKKERNNNNYAPLIAAFTEATGLIPPNDSTSRFHDKWLEPLDALLNLAGGNVAEAERLIAAAVQALRSNSNGRRYTIAAPASILTAAANLPGAAERESGSLWQSVKAAAAAGDPSMVPPMALESVRAVGWGALCAMTDNQENDMRGRFLLAVGGQQ